MTKAQTSPLTAARTVIRWPVISDELRQALHQLAAKFIARERPGHTWQATVLLDDLLLELGRQETAADMSADQVHAFAAMYYWRRLTDHARRKKALKRGGGRIAVTLNPDDAPDRRRPNMSMDDHEALELALNRLAQRSARQHSVAVLRYIGGLTGEETARSIGLSPRQVDKDWQVAQAWLHRELQRIAQT